MKTLYRSLAATALFFSVSASYALPVTQYAETSKLASGKWRTVTIASEGMQLISNQQLKTMGFSDPSKVNVYGYGGRSVSEALTTDTYVDDLPLQPVIRTENGIIFFGTGTMKWEFQTSSYVPYRPVQNYYTTTSTYFLSDRELSEGEINNINVVDGTPFQGGTDVTTFSDLLVHERELIHPSNTGNLMLGEDFRTNTSQDFNFTLKDIAPESEAGLCISFATKTSSASTSIVVTANGKTLGATENDIIPPSDGSERFLQIKRSYKAIENPQENLSINIKYNPGGVVYLANLDYISVAYERMLRLDEGRLHFLYNNKNINAILNVEGCTSTTEIWEVTNPAAPVKINYVLEGSTARFTPTGRGSHEYIAFEPARVNTAPISGTTVQNQDVHSMEVPDMVIISPRVFYNQAERVAEMHRSKDGFTVHVVTPEALYNEFSSGGADAMAFRKALKMWYDKGMLEGSSNRSKLKYCLLFGRPTYDQRMITDKVKNSGYTRTLQWQTTEAYVQTTSFGMDDYLAMLDDSEFGIESIMAGAKLRIGVGRFPVRLESDAREGVDKLLAYSENPGYGSWRNRVTMIADDGDAGVHMNQTDKMMLPNLVATRKGADFRYEKIYLDAYPLSLEGTGASVPEAKNKMMQLFNSGTSVVNYIGHANPREWTAEALLTYTDITFMSNKNLPVFYTATCQFARWDDDEISGGEIMWANPTAGAIAMMSTTRTVYISYNGTLSLNVGKYMFSTDTDNKAVRLGDVYRLAKNNFSSPDDNKLRYVLLGDPAMRMPMPYYTVKTTSLDGMDIANVTADSEEMPVLKANSKVNAKGEIVDPDGNILSSFNGYLYVDLYDAEKVMTTLGRDNEESPASFNDRPTRLFSSKVKVTGGRWDTSLLIPSEIEGNWSPALLSLYAASDDGIEANGHFDNFYVYGWNEDGTSDTEGPEITGFGLNTPNFTNGGTVSSMPVVLARLSDESGINISSAGIGHKLRLTLDGKTHFDDLENYFTPAEDDIFSGDICYPMSELSDGEHTLTLTAWDNAGNISSADIDFKVTVSPKPTIYDVVTDANPAVSSVTFTILHDRIQELTDARIDVYDLSGRRVWSKDLSSKGGYDETTQMTWDLTDGSGHRVDRGIYIYRASLTSEEGVTVSKSNKLAVAAK